MSLITLNSPQWLLPSEIRRKTRRGRKELKGKLPSKKIKIQNGKNNCFWCLSFVNATRTVVYRKRASNARIEIFSLKMSKAYLIWWKQNENTVLLSKRCPWKNGRLSMAGFRVNRLEWNEAYFCFFCVRIISTCWQIAFDACFRFVDVSRNGRERSFEHRQKW